MKPGVKKPIPAWIKRRMPYGIERLNTLRCRYYGIKGLSRKVRDWYSGMFMEFIYDFWKADHILDLQEGVYWFTGKENPNSVKRIEQEHKC